MTGKHHVRRALALARAGEQIAAKQSRALYAHKRPSIVGFCHGLVACRQIADHGRTVTHELCGRRVDRPKILADLDADHKLRHRFAAEKKFAAEGHALTAQRNLCVFIGRGAEKTLLVELAVIRQNGFRHCAEELAALQHHSAVEQAEIGRKRHSEHDDHIRIAAGCENGRKPRDGRTLQGVLKEQIARRVACHTKLRQR